jgi:hypothetical protein
VLGQPGVSSVVVLIGINDLLWDGASSAQIIAGYRELIARAHAASVTIIGSPITPLRAMNQSPAVEQRREEVNAWVRTSGEFDLVVDFDAVLRDDSDPRFVEPVLTYDGLHPNAGGNGDMAIVVPLAAIAPTVQASSASVASASAAPASESASSPAAPRLGAPVVGAEVATAVNAATSTLAPSTVATLGRADAGSTPPLTGAGLAVTGSASATAVGAAGLLAGVVGAMMLFIGRRRPVGALGVRQ